MSATHPTTAVPPVPGSVPAGTSGPLPASGPVHSTVELPGGAIWAPGVMARTWREYFYLFAALLVAPFAFAYAIIAVVLPPAIAVTVVGLFLAAWVITGGRIWGALYRGMARGMLGTAIAPPVPRRRRRGFWRKMGGLLGDASGWRGIAFGALAFPLSIVSFVISTTFLAIALGGVTHWYWYRFLPLQEAGDGTMHRGASFGTDYFIDTPARQWILIGVGLLCFLIWHRVVLGFGNVFRMLSVNLLGPTAASLRVAHLEQSRGAVVTDAAVRLRQIERDLHDGTQARLVAVAMQIGDARDRLALEASVDPAHAETVTLLDDAHASLKETLTELREIARGIHPPALDGGLAVALETLGARCPVPVTVDVDLPGRQPPGIETIAYFAVAELLANVVRHSGASGAYVRAEVLDGALRVRVRDDGHGGARPGLPGASGGTGLSGLGDRVAAVDGSIDVDSPVGGPTVVTVHLPLSATR